MKQSRLKLLTPFCLTASATFCSHHDLAILARALWFFSCRPVSLAAAVEGQMETYRGGPR